MTKKVQPKAATELFVPLNKLKKSPKNVRKMPHTEADIEALAASIGANGLLQNLVVEPEVANGKSTGCYLVNVGEGRRLALLLRAKRKEIRKDEPIRCLLGNAERAEEVSLAENVIRVRMHPADEYEAYAFLHDKKGLAAEDIAARFGVHVGLVRQRLRLGAVSPKLMALYRDGQLTLEQLMAFTVTDDHARQEQVWQMLDYNNGAHAIRRALTEGQVPSDDRRAAFVGAEAYEAAGGVITRDLFDDETGGYFADAALLDRLVAVRLEEAAQAVRAEGWAWVMVTPTFDYRAGSDMRRVYPVLPDLSEADQHRHGQLEAEYEQVVIAGENAEDEAASEEIAARIEVVETAMEALKGEPVYAPEDIARSGAFVTLGHDGGLRVERGFIRKADEPPAAVRPGETGAGDEDDSRETSTALPDRLLMQLTAQRTMALREAVASRPDVAFVTVVHALAASTFYLGSSVTCLEVGARSQHLSGYAPGIDDTPAARALAARHEALAALLPAEVTELWDALWLLTRDQLKDLLAYCAALTIDGVIRTGGKSSGALKHAEALSQAVSLDMTRHWQPTKDNYLGQVTKAVIMDAVREGVSPQAAENLAALKKPAMAEAAEQLLAEKGWLPTVLRLPRSPDTLAA